MRLGRFTIARRLRTPDEEVTMRRFLLFALLLFPFTPEMLSAQQPATKPQADTPASGTRVTVVRSCEVAEGRMEQARTFATDILAAVKAAGGKPPFESAAAYEQVLGELGRFHFILEFTDMNAVGMWLAGPPPGKVQDMLKQSATLFPKCEDTVLRQLGQRQQF